MNKKLANSLKRLQPDIEYYNSLLKVFSNDQLNYKPDANSWSMMQVMHHLYISMKISMQFVNNFDFNRKSEKLGIKAQLKTIFLVNRLNSNKRYKAPKVLRDADSKFNLPTNKEAFEVEWNKLQEELFILLENFPEDKLNYFSFYQPAVGKMNIIQMLHFFKAHLKHHQHQIERINHHDDFPM